MKYSYEDDRDFADCPVPEDEDLYGIGASAFDCTGLIPTPPQSDEEYDAYDEIYPFLPDDNEQ